MCSWIHANKTIEFLVVCEEKSTPDSKHGGCTVFSVSRYTI